MNQSVNRLRCASVASFQNYDYEAYRFYHQVSQRAAMSDRDERYVLSGTMEMDERYFESVNSEYKGSPKRPAKRGRGSEKQNPILVMAETTKVKKQTAKIVLPWVHLTIGNAKRNLLSCYHHIDDIFLLNYLDEFTYELNRRYFGEKIFDRLLITCVSFS